MSELKLAYGRVRHHQIFVYFLNLCKKKRSQEPNAKSWALNQEIMSIVCGPRTTVSIPRWTVCFSYSLYNPSTRFSYFQCDECEILTQMNNSVLGLPQTRCNFIHLPQAGDGSGGGGYKMHPTGTV